MGSVLFRIPWISGCIPKASVRQDRNEHDLTKDMKAEYLGYENNLLMVSELKKDSNAIRKYLPKNALRSFDLYQKHFR